MLQQTPGLVLRSGSLPDVAAPIAPTHLPATATVVRAGVRGEIQARHLAPGDVPIVAEGDRVSADARITGGR